MLLSQVFSLTIKWIDINCHLQVEDVDKRRTKEMKEYLDAKNREVNIPQPKTP
jgi:hypothetical protein